MGFRALTAGGRLTIETTAFMENSASMQSQLESPARVTAVRRHHQL